MGLTGRDSTNEAFTVALADAAPLPRPLRARQALKDRTATFPRDRITAQRRILHDSDFSLCQTVSAKLPEYSRSSTISPLDAACV